MVLVTKDGLNLTPVFGSGGAIMDGRSARYILGYRAHEGVPAGDRTLRWCRAYLSLAVHLIYAPRHLPPVMLYRYDM